MNHSISEPAQDNASAANRAAGSSFYLAMRILPRPQREGMYEIYGFCRHVDDIADSDMPRPQRLQHLARWRRDIDALFAGEVPHDLQSLARIVDHFGLRREDFLAVIEGMEMDAAEDIRAPDFVTLDLYCDRVASAVGRMSVRIFGMDRENGDLLAHHLGRALQLTNILRDLDEDAAVGRLYLPREALHQAGITETQPTAAISSPTLAKACDPVIRRARTHFAEAEKIMDRCPQRVIRAPRIMGAVYRALLEGMVARGWGAPRVRVRISRPRLLSIALRYAFV